MDESLRTWDLRPYAPTDRCLKIFRGHTHSAMEQNLLRCDWSCDGKMVTAGSSDGLVVRRRGDEGDEGDEGDQG